MNIKTVTTYDGVNVVDFGSAASRFYWFRNIGTSTVYVSGNSDIAAGSDGVAELPAGGSVCIETLGGKVYVLGVGKVQIHNTGDKFCPFRNAPVSSGGGVSGYDLGYSEIALGFLNGGGKYNGSFDWEKNRLAITKDYIDYAIMHSYAIDFTNVKKIVISGAVTSNLSGLTAAAYCKISDNIQTELNTDEWTDLETNTPAAAYDLLDFSVDIDCAAISGEKYINLAIWHGTESNSYTAYLYVDRVEFIYG